mmetsp:Transcript_59984/g.175318  ORF Transcript_59984/g.175318 Transcript_59984/m.175318 type:complete len:108 (+) Transcript_59984:526-849(+)
MPPCVSQEGIAPGGRGTNRILCGVKSAKADLSAGQRGSCSNHRSRVPNQLVPLASARQGTLVHSKKWNSLDLMIGVMTPPWNLAAPIRESIKAWASEDVPHFGSPRR